MNDVARRFTFVHLLLAVAGTALATFAAVKLYQILTSAPYDSPVKVRGGAMTFRTKKNVPFQNLGGDNYCVSLGAPSTVQIDLFQPGSDPSGIPDKSATLSNGAQIDFLGSTADGSNASSNGSRILITNNPCGSSTGLIATLQPEGTSSGFYKNRNNASDEDDSHLVRFQDLPCSQSPPSPTADEDTCEHLNTIYINSSPTSSPTSGTKWHCRNGECLVKIHP